MVFIGCKFIRQQTSVTTNVFLADPCMPSSVQVAPRGKEGKRERRDCVRKVLEERRIR